MVRVPSNIRYGFVVDELVKHVIILDIISFIHKKIKTTL